MCRIFEAWSLSVGVTDQACGYWLAGLTTVVVQSPLLILSQALHQMSLRLGPYSGHSTADRNCKPCMHIDCCPCNLRESMYDGLI